MFSTEEFIAAVVAGQYVTEIENSEFRNMIGKAINRPQIKQKIISAKSHLERVHLMSKDFANEDFMDLLCDVEYLFEKDEMVTKKLRVKADNLYKARNFDKAVRCYNLALLFAPTGSSWVGRIYALRALLFHALGESEACLQDVQSALKYTCASELTSRLLKIRVEYLTPRIYCEPDQLTLRKMEARKFRDEVIYKIHGMRNPKIQSGAECLRINYSKEKGRYLTTESELKPGATIIVEEPFAVVLDNILTWDTAHCSKCLKKITRNVPCETCVFVSYCSEECREKDLKEGHKYECKCYPYMHASRLFKVYHLGLRAICKEGPSNLYKLWIESQKANTDEKDEDQVQGMNPETGCYDSDSYHQLLHLKSHIDEETLAYLTWTSVAIIKVLNMTSDFFSEVENFKNPDFHFFVASLFLSHGISFTVNGVSLGDDVDFKLSEDGEIQKFTHVPVASVIYSFISLMSHSCYPSVFRDNLPNGKMAMVTYRTLYPGDEITLSYGLVFTSDNLIDRQKEFSKHYRFLCQCIACTLAWPLQNELPLDMNFLCPNCSDHYKISRVEQIQKCTLEQNGNVGFCKNCQKMTKLKKIKTEAERIEEQLSQVLVLVTKSRLLDAVPLLIECVLFYQKYIVPPNKTLMFAESILFDLFYMITRTNPYLPESVPVTGPES